MSKIINKLYFRKGWYKYYKENVRGNENISLQDAQKKMSVNKILAYEKVDKVRRNTTLYQYGCLKFLVDRKGSIVWMKNNCTPLRGWKVDVEKREQLKREFGIV